MCAPHEDILHRHRQTDSQCVAQTDHRGPETAALLPFPENRQLRRPEKNIIHHRPDRAKLRQNRPHRRTLHPEPRTRNRDLHTG